MPPSGSPGVRVFTAYSGRGGDPVLMRPGTLLTICLACALFVAARADAVRAQAGPLPYAGGPGPAAGPIGPFMRGPFMRGPFMRPFVRGPFLRPPRGPFALPLAHGPFAHGPFGYGPFARPPVAAFAPPPRRRFEPPDGRVCFNPVEARDEIAAHRLREPFQALRLGRWRGEALRARLCRWAPEQFVYEIAVLRRDGLIVHVYMNAQNGQNVGGPAVPEE